MAEYAEGSLVKLTGTFTDEVGAAVDPSVVKVAIEKSDGTTTTYTYGTDPEVTKPSTGIYQIQVDTTGKPGYWHYRWYSTGSGQTATTRGRFRVIGAYPA